MAKKLEVTDAQLGQWIHTKDHQSLEGALVAIVQLAQEYGFDFPDQESYQECIPMIIANDMDEDMETDFMFLVRDAVDYLNDFIVNDGYRFVVRDGLALTRWGDVN